VLRSEQLAAVGQLAAGLAHELRNPLMAMKVLVQSASELGEEHVMTTTDLHVLEEEIDRLERLVKVFLDFAQPPRLQQRVFQLDSAIRSVMHLLEPRAIRRGVHVVLRSSHSPVEIEADESQVRQVVMNLLINAMEAVRSGGRVEIRLGSLMDETSASWTTIDVVDDGCGLPAELGSRIFDPFISTKETGVGLGLSICRRIVESHGGAIQCADSPTGGSVFTVQLPTRNPVSRPCESVVEPIKELEALKR
jgi:signal transduction histidine kinase